MRTEGTYRLKLTLFEVIGANVHHCKSIFSAPFYVYTAKKFPGMEGVCVLLFSFRFEFLSLSLSLSFCLCPRSSPFSFAVDLVWDAGADLS